MSTAHQADPSPNGSPARPRASLLRQFLTIGLLAAAAGGIGYKLFWNAPAPGPDATPSAAPQAAAGASFKPTEGQWAGLTMQDVVLQPFRSEVVTDGKIAIDEDHATPVFSPYAGQVRRLAVQPGEVVKAGPLLFGIHNWANVFTKNSLQNGGGYIALVIRPGNGGGFRVRESKEYTCPRPAY